jgi:hypothetical protein
MAKAECTPLLCVIHIPKTAGTSLRIAFRSILNGKLYWHGDDSWGTSAAQWDAVTSADFNGYHVIGGHLTVDHFSKIQRPKIFFAVVRDPIRRAASLFEFIVNQPSHYLHDELRGRTILEAIQYSARFRLEITNGQCFLIGGAPTYKAAKRSLSRRAWMIARYEEVEQLFAHTCERFLWPVVRLPRENPNQRQGYFDEYATAEITGALTALNSEDMRLHRSLASC